MRLIIIKGKIQKIENEFGSTVMTIKMEKKDFNNLYKEIEKNWLKTYDDLIDFHYGCVSHMTNEINFDIPEDRIPEMENRFIFPNKNIYAQIDYDKEKNSFYLIEM